MSERQAAYNANEPLVFYGEIIKVQTMESGAIRLTLDLPEHETVLMAKLAECKRRGAVLDIEAVPKAPSEEQTKKSALYGIEN